MSFPFSWQAGRTPSTVRGMTADHYAQITTPRGSTVVFPDLTTQQATDIAEQYGSPSEFPKPLTASSEKTTCERCDGAGGWEETVETKSKHGSTVITMKWVNCRPCGGTGRLPK